MDNQLFEILKSEMTYLPYQEAVIIDNDNTEIYTAPISKESMQVASNIKTTYEHRDISSLIPIPYSKIFETKQIKAEIGKKWHKLPFSHKIHVKRSKENPEKMALKSNYFYPLKPREHELMQYLCPVGSGPSLNTWPRWPPHFLQ